MSFQFIIGGSGSGKSRRLYQEIIEASGKHPEQKYLVLVPEQFTMQTQKDLVALHPAHGIMNIDVLSFQRLAYHVFDEVGQSRRTVLQETGKSLVIRRLAQQNRDKLSVLGSKLERMGYVGEMKSVLSELTQYNVSREQLLKAAKEAGDNRLLKEKLQDILVLWDAFREYMSDQYITSEEVLALLCQAADQSSMLRGCVAVLDGFTGFTPIQYVFLGKLLEQAEKVIVTVTMDVREYPFHVLREEELFALSKQTIWELRRIAGECGVKEEEPVLMSSSPRFEGSEALAFLEQHILRYDGAVFEGEPKGIYLGRATDPEQEVFQAARQICHLVYEEGFRYRDIAVITGDMDGYGPYVQRQFTDSHIPCFIDYKRDILSNPFVEFLRSAFQILEEDFSYSSVFRYVRCGLTGIEPDAADRMDNYCMALGIRGYKNYEKEWTRVYSGQDPEELELLNRTRVQLLYQLREFKEGCSGRNKTVRQRTESLYRLCERLEIQKQLAEYEADFLKQKNLALAKEYAQVYRIMIELFDKLVELMGEEQIPLKEYSRILEAGFEEAKVGVIPPSTDQVMVGDMERTRLNDIRVLFFIGVNDGIIPFTRDRAGILSSLDRESLKGMRIHLAPGRKENAWIQQFYLYANLTKPSERLYISYSARNRKGEALRPSYLIGMLRELYPRLNLFKEEEILPLKAASRRQALVELALHIGNGSLSKAELQVLKSVFLQEGSRRSQAEALLDAAGERQTSLSLDRAVAKALYGDELKGSVTRLEKYASCAYAHFLSYGLRLRERKEYTFAAMDLGNILHRALELYTRTLEGGSYTWFDIPEEEQELLMDQCVEQVAADYGNTVLMSSSRNTYMIQRMKQMGRRTVWAVTCQVRRGKFVPRGFEVEFSAADHLHAVSFTLKDGTRMKLTGRIDRTDIYEDETSVYVKVIDYKTGAKSFDVGDVYYGLSLQLAVYLNAAMEMEQRTHAKKLVIPAAMLYYQIKDPILESEAELSEAAMQDAFLKELCTRGLVNSDPDIIELLDSQKGGAVPVIPASVTKGGTLNARSSAADTDQIRRLSDHVKDQLKTFGEEIIDGNISPAPFRDGRQSACDYCPYMGICGFDPRLSGCSFRKFAPLTAAKVWEKLDQEAKEQDACGPGEEGGSVHGSSMDRGSETGH